VHQLRQAAVEGARLDFEGPEALAHALHQMRAGTPIVVRSDKPVRGQRPHAELRPDVVATARRLYRANPKIGKRRSLRQISAELAVTGHLNANGKPFPAKSVQAMIEAKQPAD
jgi:hypothetical protein